MVLEKEDNAADSAAEEQAYEKVARIMPTDGKPRVTEREAQTKKYSAAKGEVCEKTDGKDCRARQVTAGEGARDAPFFLEGSNPRALFFVGARTACERAKNGDRKQRDGRQVQELGKLFHGQLRDGVAE